MIAAAYCKRETADIPVTTDCMGGPVPFLRVAVWYNGWPAGIFGPAGGPIAAGECANEDTLIEALDAAIKRAREERR